MVLADNLKMLYCLNDNGLDKANELLKGFLENEEYIQTSLEQLEKETNESSEQRNIQWRKEEDERKLKKETKKKQIEQQYGRELSIIKKQTIPVKQLDLLYAINDIEESNAITLWSAYSWGHIQGKRDERARRKKANPVDCLEDKGDSSNDNN